MLYFKSVTLTGFGSYIEETKFKLNRPGLNIVIGENGGGKTTAFSAIRWALFGVSLKGTKDVTTWKHLQPKGFQGTKVVLKFKKDNINYEVIRTKDYKGKLFGAKAKDKLILVENGKPWVDSSKKKDTEAEIHRLIGFNDELFMGSVIFGQRMKKLIESSGPDKKRLFEEAFSAGFIQDALIRAKEDLKDATEELSSEELKLDRITSDRDGLKLLIKKMEEFKQSWEKERKSRMREVKAEIEEIKADNNKPEVSEEEIENSLNVQRKKIKKAEDGIKMVETHFKKTLDPLQEELGDIMKQLAINTSSEGSYKYQIRSLESPKPMCPTCGSGMDPKKAKKLLKETQGHLGVLLTKDKADREAYKEVKAELRKNEEDREEKLKQFNKDRDSAKNKIRSLENELKNINSQKEQKERTTKRLTKLKDTLKNLINDKGEKYDTTKEQKALKKIKSEIAKAKPLVEDLKQKVDDLKWLVGDMLSNKGLKAYIFNRMLTQLNEKLRYYEQFIGYRVEFSVDLEGGNKDIYTVCYTNEVAIYYEDLSGGEKQLVDAATAFALFDVISSSRPVNLLVFDEPFEGLTEENTEILSELIQQKSMGKSVYLISHNVDLQQSSHKIIRIRKDKRGQTILKQL